MPASRQVSLISPARMARQHPRARQAAAAGLLAAACVAWSALPVQHSAELFSKPLLVAAAGCAVLGTARLAVGAEHSYPAGYHSVPERAGLGLLVIATGAVLLPVPAGQAAGWLSALAVTAAILAGALALPV